VWAVFRIGTEISTYCREIVLVLSARTMDCEERAAARARIDSIAASIALITVRALQSYRRGRDLHSHDHACCSREPSGYLDRHASRCDRKLCIRDVRLHRSLHRRADQRA